MSYNVLHVPTGQFLYCTQSKYTKTIFTEYEIGILRHRYTHVLLKISSPDELTEWLLADCHGLQFSSEYRLRVPILCVNEFALVQCND